jgi:hypothetical protein
MFGDEMMNLKHKPFLGRPEGTKCQLKLLSRSTYRDFVGVPP